MKITGWHVETQGALEGPFGKPELYICLDLDVTGCYAEGGGAVYEVTYEAENPLVVTDGNVLAALLGEAEQGLPAGAYWHPATTTRVAALLRERGHDALVLPAEGFDTADQDAWEAMRGSYGDPQAVLLDPGKATISPYTGPVPVPDRRFH